MAITLCIIKNHTCHSAYMYLGFNEGCQQNKIVLRYADVLLMNAEANNELGNSAPRYFSWSRYVQVQVAAMLLYCQKLLLQIRRLYAQPFTMKEELNLPWSLTVILMLYAREEAPLYLAHAVGKPAKTKCGLCRKTEIDMSGGALTQNPGY
jgi:hypothetical protein